MNSRHMRPHAEASCVLHIRNEGIAGFESGAGTVCWLRERCGDGLPESAAVRMRLSTLAAVRRNLLTLRAMWSRFAEIDRNVDKIPSQRLFSANHSSLRQKPANQSLTARTFSKRVLTAGNPVKSEPHCDRFPQTASSRQSVPAQSAATRDKRYGSLRFCEMATGRLLRVSAHPQALE